jgi:tetratricopeptide (TPR) repeat protein
VASGAAVLLIAFAVMQTAELRRITRERDRADRITEFMTSMFKVSDPSEARGNSITAREILDKSSKEIDNGLARDPELKAQMLDVMGTVYEGLGIYPRAESLLKKAVDIRRNVLGPEHRGTLSSARLLAWTTSEEGRYTEAEKMMRDLVDTDNRVLGADDRATLVTESNLAWTLELAGHFADAEKLSQQTLERQQYALGLDDPDTIERDLQALLPPRAWTAFAHRLIHHGRRVCAARTPRCSGCALRRWCPQIGVTNSA